MGESVSEWEKSVGESDEWYTPPCIFEAIGLLFDIDVAAPAKSHWTPAKNFFTKEDDGLMQDWYGTVWMNPPFGGRNGHVPWLEKFINHGDGIALLAARTSAGWFHDWIPRADAVLFPRGKTKFIRPDGSIGKSPGSGVVLIAMGEKSCRALRDSGLGIYLPIYA